MTNTGTHSQNMANKHIGATQSGLDKYIADRVKNDSEFKPIDQSKQIVKGTQSRHAMTKTGTQSFRETIKPEQFGLVKSLGTHSIFSETKIHKGVTPSHPALHYTKQTIEFKTQSSINQSFGLKMESGKITYNNPNLIKGTHSNFTWVSKPAKSIKVNSNTHSNAMIHASKISITQSGTMSIKMPKFGMNAKLNGSTVGSTASMLNNAKRFYAKVNNSTQKLDAKPFIQFISELSDNAETMINTKKVTVNGIIVTDSNYLLKSGDIVRVGIGHYINNSKQTAIVK